MDTPLTVRQAYLVRVDELLGQGRRLQERLAADSSAIDGSNQARAWQRDCATLVSDLSGGSKAHWLSRAHSEAFLIRSPDGRAIGDAPIAEIVGRLVGVLGQARLSLTQAGDSATTPSTSGPRRFDFVHDTALRPVLEAAYLDSRRAFEEGQFGTALVIACGLLEAIVTDALAHADAGLLAARGVPEGPVAAWPFDARLANAERAGLIRGGCARLPPVARRYSELANADGELGPGVEISERDARLAGQVLNVVMRDLNPGR